MDLILAIMNRDGITEEESQKMVGEMRGRVLEGENPEEILYEEGFESDYIFDIMPY